LADAKNQREPEDSERVENTVLKRLLAMPPQPKPKKENDANAKKRGRPPRAKG